jgi:hypothetical protein
MVAAVREGRPNAAERVQAMLPEFDVYGLSVPAIPGFKAAAAAIGRIPRATCRLDAGAEAEVVAAAEAGAAARQRVEAAC